MPGVQAPPSQRRKGSPTGVEGLETLQPGSLWVTEMGRGRGHVWSGTQTLKMTEGAGGSFLFWGLLPEDPHALWPAPA